MTDAPDDEQQHRLLRELLGSHALGQLPAAEATAVQAHLDGCVECRAELAALTPLVDDLRTVDPDRLSTLASPPADLGDRIRAAVASERVLRDRRERRSTWRRRVLAAAAAVALVITGTVLGGALLPRTQVVEAAPPGPFEPIEVVTGLPGLEVTRAGVVPHAWGVEVKIEGTGFTDGQAFRAVVIGPDGTTRPAGEFLGTGDETVKCNLQAALPRRDTSRFVITDAAGIPVLSADLPT